MNSIKSITKKYKRDSELKKLDRLLVTIPENLKKLVEFEILTTTDEIEEEIKSINNILESAIKEKDYEAIGESIKDFTDFSN